MLTLALCHDNHPIILLIVCFFIDSGWARCFCFYRNCWVFGGWNGLKLDGYRFQVLVNAILWLTVELNSLHSLLPPGGKGAVQPWPRPLRTQHGWRGVVTGAFVRCRSNSFFTIFNAFGSIFLILRAHQAAEECSASSSWREAAASCLTTPTCLWHTSWFHWDRYRQHHGEWALNRWGRVLNKCNKEINK